MMKLNKLWHRERTYISEWSIKECLDSINKAPFTFGPNPFNPEQYKVDQISNYQISIIFCGRVYGKARQTEFLATFYIEEYGTVIHMQFQREIFGLPPCTPDQVLDCFAKERLNGNLLLNNTADGFA